MKVDVAEIAGATVLRPVGRIDSTTSALLAAAVQPEGVTPPRLLLDFSGVTYISSAGLRVVLMAAKAARTTRGAFVVFGLIPAVLTVFQMSGFDRVVTLVDTEAEAIAKLPG